MIEGKRRRGRPRICYTSQVIQDARVDPYIHLKEKHKIENHGKNIYCTPIYGLKKKLFFY